MINSFRGEYNWLSNMTACEIEHLGGKFKSVENAYMCSKNPMDVEWIHKCLTLPPNEVKKLSKYITVREDWEEVKIGIMYTLMLKKFKQEPFRSKLLATGNENIVEGNYWNDTFWGVDLKVNPNTGENHLGRLIMHIRIKLKNGSA